MVEIKRWWQSNQSDGSEINAYHHPTSEVMQSKKAKIFRHNDKNDYRFYYLIIFSGGSHRPKNGSDMADLGVARLR